MLMVLFIIMAIAIISTGFIARSDSVLACDRNFCVHTEVDYVAWAGLEVAWALVQDPNSVRTVSAEPVTWESMPGIYYDLDIASTANPDVYSVSSAAYLLSGGNVRARSQIDANLFYDSDDDEYYYVSISRP